MLIGQEPLVPPPGVHTFPQETPAPKRVLGPGGHYCSLLCVSLPGEGRGVAQVESWANHPRAIADTTLEAHRFKQKLYSFRVHRFSFRFKALVPIRVNGFRAQS